MIEAIRAAAELVPFTVHEYEFEPGRAPKPTDYPFVVLWADPGLEFSGNTPGWDDSLADEVDAIELDIRATYTGMSKESVGVLARRTREALNRTILVVPGWACSRLKQSPVQGIQRDRDVQVGHGNPYYAIDEYRLIATREI